MEVLNLEKWESFFFGGWDSGSCSSLWWQVARVSITSLAVEIITLGSLNWTAVKCSWGSFIWKRARTVSFPYQLRFSTPKIWWSCFQRVWGCVQTQPFPSPGWMFSVQNDVLQTSSRCALCVSMTFLVPLLSGVSETYCLAKRTPRCWEKGSCCSDVANVLKAIHVRETKHVLCPRCQVFCRGLMSVCKHGRQQ